jgi:hypothetical protein
MALFDVDLRTQQVLELSQTELYLHNHLGLVPHFVSYRKDQPTLQEISQYQNIFYTPTTTSLVSTSSPDFAVICEDHPIYSSCFSQLNIDPVLASNFLLAYGSYSKKWDSNKNNGYCFGFGVANHSYDHTRNTQDTICTPPHS